MTDRGEMRGAFIAWGGELGVPVTKRYLDRLDPFWDLLLRWSRRVDLTGYRDREAVMRGLLAPTLALAAAGAIRGAGPVLDVGSGAGIPGIPLAALYPETPFDLVEPRERRVLFLREAVGLLSLKNARPVRGRIEDLPPVPAYATAVSRAIDPIPLLATMEHLLASGASWWVQSSGEPFPRPGVSLPVGWEASPRVVRDPVGREITFVRLSRRLRLAEQGGEGVP
jgi:16S rRNA (guanine527-N7)-methyltransferase